MPVLLFVMSMPPGTVSKISWHFTGGPTWDRRENRQNKKRKPLAAAYAALLGILATRELRVGEYREVVKVRVQEPPEYDNVAKKMRRRRTVLTELHSSAVCCLADIPVAHLRYHAKRYGQVAIGFHRSAVLRHGFNPVFYTLHATSAIRALYKALAEIQTFNGDFMREQANVITGEAEEWGIHLGWETAPLRRVADDMDEGVAVARANIEHFLSFVKTFEAREFSTIYCEREWRAIKPFRFDLRDVAMIVLPRRAKGATLFDSFTAKDANVLNLPRAVPVVAWEDLSES